MIFSEKIRTLMKVRSLSQYEMARKLNISTSMVHGWLNGSRPQRRTAVKLANFFQVSVDELLDDRKSCPKLEAANEAVARTRDIDDLIEGKISVDGFFARFKAREWRKIFEEWIRDYRKEAVELRKEAVAFREKAIELCKKADVREKMAGDLEEKLCPEKVSEQMPAQSSEIVEVIANRDHPARVAARERMARKREPSGNRSA